MKESEFGRGYATCLLMFTWHAPRLQMKGRGIHNVMLWANASSDHLYELTVGGRVSRRDGKIAKEMAAQALDCGHGYRYPGMEYTEADALRWIGIATALLVNVGNPQTIEEAMEIDRKLGLRAEQGTWGCSEPMKPW
jgi:hypothetical protein